MIRCSPLYIPCCSARLPMSQRGKKSCWGWFLSCSLLYPFIVAALLIWSLVFSWHNVTVRNLSGHAIVALLNDGAAFNTASLPILRMGNVVLDADDGSDEDAPWQASDRDYNLSLIQPLPPVSPDDYIHSEDDEPPDRSSMFAEQTGHDASADKFILPVLRQSGGAEEDEHDKNNTWRSASKESKIPSNSSTHESTQWSDPKPRHLENVVPPQWLAHEINHNAKAIAAIRKVSDNKSTVDDNHLKIEVDMLTDGPYHDQTNFKEEYDRMLTSFKIFVYPLYVRNHPFSNIFAPMDGEARSNYASESYFKKAVFKSKFITENASEADMFYLPFSITLLRHDKRVGIRKMNKFISSYITGIRQKWPYWNRTGGADHFYVSCHSITKLASDNIVYLRRNAIQVVCSSNLFVRGYVPHKDIPIPQVWPRKGTPSQSKLVKQRKTLAFFAGAANSPVRAALVKAWSKDKDILVYSKRLSTPYSQALLTSKFCLHVKGYEVNTARIADALHFGCIPVILADYYDLPFASILDWSKFSLVVETSDIPLLKEVLQEVSYDRYEELQRNVMMVRRHFQWNSPPCEYDAFYMAMYELWSRRHVIRSVI